MATAYTTAQKIAIQRVVSFTGYDRTSAAKILRANHWDVEQVMNRFIIPSNEPERWHVNLNKLFDSYGAAKSTNRFNLADVEKYLKDIQVSPDEPASLVVHTIVQTPSLGEMTRQGFVNGWGERQADTIQKQANDIKQLAGRLSDPAVMKPFYKHVFILAKRPRGSGVPWDDAKIYWQLLFSPSGLNWSRGATPWLEYWLEFRDQIKERNRDISRDLWNELFKFAEKTLSDDTASFWSEGQAWPGVIDDFVKWLSTNKGVGQAPKLGVDAMMEV